MRTVFGVALAVGLVAAATAARADDDKPAKIDAKKLVGKWRTADEGKGEKMVIEFAKGGKVTVEADIDGKSETKDGTYKLDGNKLTVTLSLAGREKTTTLTVTKLTDDELVTREEGKKPETLKRIKEKDKK